MRIPWLLPGAVLLAGVPAWAQDPLASGPCRQALDALRAQEEAVHGAAVPPLPAASQHLAQARQQAARACLQGRADAPAPPPARLALPPLEVPPLALPPPPARLPMPVPTPLPPPPRPGPPPALTSCDALGCWASDGTRLQRAGPNLLGPRGLCSVTGTLLQCP